MTLLKKLLFIFLFTNNINLFAQEVMLDSSRVTTFGINGNFNSYLGHTQDRNTGQVSVAATDGFFNATMYVDSGNQNGQFFLLDSNQVSNIILSSASIEPSSGFIGNCDEGGIITANIANRPIERYGIFGSIGPNGNRNFQVDAVGGLPNHGYLSVYDSNDQPQSGMFVDGNGMGVVFGDIKNFRMTHPIDNNKEIWYASIEGPEAGAYIRGTGSLKNGRAEIGLPEHFILITSSSSLTVTLTPLSIDSKGLAVIEKDVEKGRILIGELFEGVGEYAFDWEVKAVRRGFEDYQVIREKGILSPPPPPNPSKTNSSFSFKK